MQAAKGVRIWGRVSLWGEGMESTLSTKQSAVAIGNSVPVLTYNQWKYERSQQLPTICIQIISGTVILAYIHFFETLSATRMPANE